MPIYMYGCVVCADKAFEFKAIYESLALGLQQSAYADSLQRHNVSPHKIIHLCIYTR